MAPPTKWPRRSRPVRLRSSAARREEPTPSPADHATWRMSRGCLEEARETFDLVGIYIRHGPERQAAAGPTHEVESLSGKMVCSRGFIASRRRNEEIHDVLIAHVHE